MTLLAPRIGNDVSYVTQIIADIHFAWQVQYLVTSTLKYTAMQRHDITAMQRQKLRSNPKKVWTAHWSVILRTFYRQILSWLYSSFFS